MCLDCTNVTVHCLMKNRKDHFAGYFFRYLVEPNILIIITSVWNLIRQTKHETRFSDSKSTTMFLIFNQGRGIRVISQETVIFFFTNTVQYFNLTSFRQSPIK